MPVPRTLVHALAAAVCAAPVLAQGASTRGAARRSAADGSALTTPITGTAAMFQPGVQVANLDAGDLVAGWTRWDAGGFIWIESRVGFLWSPGAGSVVFEIPLQQYLDDNWHTCQQISDDGRVVGANIFTQTLRTLPFWFTRTEGFQFFELPDASWNGVALAVSADGTQSAGSVWQGLTGLQRAARWVGGDLELLGPAGQHSQVRESSDDGAVLVGERGPSMAQPRATRWVNGLEAGLDPVPGAAVSSAGFVSDDGAITLGTATVAGRGVIARWAQDGSLTTFAPPGSHSVDVLRAINADGSAASGALVDAGDRVPFVWRLADGYHLIGELGLAYDNSVAHDLSDDGSVAVGSLQHVVQSDQSPKQKAFVWTLAGGTQDLEALQVAAGGSPLGLYTARAISGDGRRILATGVVNSSPSDTYSVILGFEPKAALK